jgi:deoxyinosine 3'endonuclease (endonuclease V)
VVGVAKGYLRFELQNRTQCSTHINVIGAEDIVAKLAWRRRRAANRTE